MKKQLLVGLALILASTFTAARAQVICGSGVAEMEIVNASGSPPVVVGASIQVAVPLPSGFAVTVFLDGNQVFSDFNPTSLGEVVNFTVTAAYGAHTLQGGCTINFTNVAPPPPPAAPPALSSSRAWVNSGGSYVLSWTVPPGSINHFTLSQSVNGQAATTTAYPASTTGLTVTGINNGPVDDNTINYMVRACSTSDDLSCSSWSNTVPVEVFEKCTPTTCY